MSATCVDVQSSRGGRLGDPPHAEASIGPAPTQYGPPIPPVESLPTNSHARSGPLRPWATIPAGRSWKLWAWPSPCVWRAARARRWQTLCGALPSSVRSGVRQWVSRRVLIHGRRQAHPWELHTKMRVRWVRGRATNTDGINVYFPSTLCSIHTTLLPGAYCAPLMAKVATESTARIQEYTSQNLSNLVRRVFARESSPAACVCLPCSNDDREVGVVQLPP